MIHNIINALMSGLFVSIPESFIWVLTVLIMMRRFDLIDKYRWKDNIWYLMLPVISSSVIINMLRFIINAPRIIISLIAILTIYISMIYILKSPKINFLNEKVKYLKLFLLVLLNFAMMIVLVESLYIPIFLKYLGKSIIEINNQWQTNILMSIPERLIQFILIMFILSIQNRKIYLDIIKSITNDKIISLIIISFITTLIVFWTFLINIIGDYNILSQYNINKQILISVSLLIIPSTLLILMISLIVLFVEKIGKLQKSHQNMFGDIYDDDIDY